MIKTFTLHSCRILYHLTCQDPTPMIMYEFALDYVVSSMKFGRKP